MSFEEFKREALKLSLEERGELFDALYDSLDEEKDVSGSKLPAEVKRRYLAIKAGTAELLDGEEVFAELRAELD
jgi:putative addiction module component (TIGR02574 family)